MDLGLAIAWESDEPVPALQRAENRSQRNGKFLAARGGWRGCEKGTNRMKRLRNRDQGQERGFSLLEMITAVAIMMIVGTITFISLVPLLKQQRVTNAYNTTIAAMRQARDNAVAQRTSYSVTFSNINVTQGQIVVAPTQTFQGDQVSTTFLLPTDIGFNALPGIPTAATPDNFGVGTAAVDFGYTYNGSAGGGQTTVYFCPDGSSQNVSGTGQCMGPNYWSGGIVYLARVGETTSSRAVTLWGGTGRIHGWRLYPKTGGGYQWFRQ